MRSIAFIAFAFLLLAPLTALAQDAPTTRPGGRPGQVFERLRESMGKLDLTDEQKAQVQQLFTEAREKLRSMRDQAGGDQENMRQQLRDVMQETRQQLMEILTPQQREQLMQLVQGGRPVEQRAPTTSPAPTSTPQAATLQPGQAAPGLSLKDLDGKRIELALLRGRVVLLVFGSYSSPSFRQRAAALEKLCATWVLASRCW